MVFIRKTVRLQTVDYSKPNTFFVTICSNKLGYYFEKYPDLYTILKTNITSLDKYFTNISISDFVIMPNHCHLLLRINYQNKDVTLGQIIATLKSKTVSDWLKFINKNKINETAKVWQRNYYEHIVRNQIEFKKIKNYILENPDQWRNDVYHPR